jgi:hypothetical protein
MKLLKPMNPNELEDHIFSTYFTLRTGMAGLAIAFPFILAIGGFIYSGLPLQNSMSAYYHSTMDERSMRNWFVGLLFAIGAFLYLYKGFSDKEDIALNFAGIFAWGIALFPMEWGCSTNCSKFSIHGTCATLFFLCISFVCIVCSSDTMKLIVSEQSKRKYKIAYYILGGLMIGSPLLAFIITLLTQQPGSIIFYIEAVGVFAFALYWLVKSRELSATNIEKLALQGYGFKKSEI